VRQLRPDFPIILCTGFSGIILKDPAGLADIDLYLEKPIEMRALSGALRSLLDDAVERGA
jgi:CheY-like chemotaxis protein